MPPQGKVSCLYCAKPLLVAYQMHRCTYQLLLPPPLPHTHMHARSHARMHIVAGWQAKLEEERRAREKKAAEDKQRQDKERQEAAEAEAERIRIFWAEYV